MDKYLWDVLVPVRGWIFFYLQTNKLDTHVIFVSCSFLLALAYVHNNNNTVPQTRPLASQGATMAERTIWWSRVRSGGFFHLLHEQQRQQGGTIGRRGASQGQGKGTPVQGYRQLQRSRIGTLVAVSLRCLLLVFPSCLARFWVVPTAWWLIVICILFIYFFIFIC